MPLTSSQNTALKTNIAANTNQVTFVSDLTGNPVTEQINQVNSVDGAGVNAVAAWYNLPASVNFFGNYATVPVTDIFNAITWKKLTPTDAVPTTPDLAVQVWKARATACQGYQFNIEIMILGRTTIDATKGKIRSGFQDSLSAVPSDVAGATQDAGWTAVQKILCRKGTNAEKLFADTSSGAGDTNTTAATFTFEGNLIGQDVQTAIQTG